MYKIIKKSKHKIERLIQNKNIEHGKHRTPHTCIHTLNVVVVYNLIKFMYNYVCKTDFQTQLDKIIIIIKYITISYLSFIKFLHFIKIDKYCKRQSKI